MGFIQAFKGALGGSFADQWKDFYVPKQGVPTTCALIPAVQQGQNAGRGSNTKLSDCVITNGSKIVVPEGLALLTIQDGQISGLIDQAGGYIFTSNDPNSQSMFSGDGIINSTIKQSWERFKFGGIPATQQMAFYINLKPILGNKFGTRTPIYWQDDYLATRAGCSANGTYSLQVVDPILFFTTLVPPLYKQPNSPLFDFADLDNEAGNQLFDDFLTCLTGAFKRFSLMSKQNGMDTIDFVQANQDKFALTMDEEVENTYKWSSRYGVKVVSVNILADYDTATLAVLEEARKADQEIRKAARMGQAYGANMPGMMAAAAGEAMKNAAANENGAMNGFVGMGMGGMFGNNMMGAFGGMNPQQPQQQYVGQPTQQPAQQTAPVEEDPFEKLSKFKKMLDAGLITHEEYDAQKSKILGV